jgi:hypothetical protein
MKTVETAVTLRGRNDRPKLFPNGVALRRLAGGAPSATLTRAAKAGPLLAEGLDAARTINNRGARGRALAALAPRQPILLTASAETA